MKKQYYGFYSAEAVANGSGTSWYDTPDGDAVEVTAVYTDPKGKDYGWEDKKCVGPVGRFLKVGRPEQKGKQK